MMRRVKSRGMTEGLAQEIASQQWHEIVEAKMTRKEREAWESKETKLEERNSIWQAARGRFKPGELADKQHHMLRGLPRAVRRTLGMCGVDYQQFGFRVLSPTVRSRRQ